MPPFRFALLGVSHPHAPGLVRQMLAHPEEFELVAVFPAASDRCDERIAAWKAAAPQLHVADDLTAALAAPIDAVAVEGAAPENVALAQAAVDRGLPVLLEKPGGASWEAFERLSEAAERRGVHLQLAYLFRYMAAVRAMFEFADAGRFGRIYEFRARLPKDLALYDEHEQDFAQFGGGMFFEMAGHLVDFATRLLGPATKVRSVLRHDHPIRGGRFVDNGAALLEHAHALSILEVTALEAAPDARRIEVYGTEGAFVIPHLGSGHIRNDAKQLYQTWTAGVDVWQTHAPPAAVLQIGDLREFAAVVRGEKAPEFSRAHDLAVHKTLLDACGMLGEA